MNNIKCYELSVLATESLTQDDINRIANKISEHFVIKKYEDEGIKRLAYAITVNGQERAHYLYFDLLERSQDAPRNLSQWLDTEDTVLRYLLVRVNELNR